MPVDHVTKRLFFLKLLIYWIGFREHLRRTPPSFMGKTVGFRLRFSLQPIHSIHYTAFIKINSHTFKTKSKKIKSIKPVP